MINEETLQEELNTILFDNEITNENKKIKIKNIKTKLILSGGGVKGIAHLGALQALQDQGILQNIDTYAGTSIGAVIGALLIIGYQPNEIFKVVDMLDLKKVKGILFGNLLKLLGLDDGNKMQIVIKKLFAGKNIDPEITFLELYERTNKTLFITAVCLNDKKTYYFSHITNPNMPVTLAIRMSISIPIYFVPVTYKGKLFIDGGCIDNYPIHLFNDCLDSVIGIYLSQNQDNVTNINNIEDYLINIIDCLFEGVTYNSLKGYEEYSIKIRLNKTSVVDFHINKEMRQKMFQDGYNTCSNMLV